MGKVTEAAASIWPSPRQVRLDPDFSGPSLDFRAGACAPQASGQFHLGASCFQLAFDVFGFGFV
ncbi:hypothetical protein, partial [uncultured Maritimibacter sp.]|uniref:hypothetical protein n=1 Tax=uncultured Maritimibacter sp. TaxID=991866 RepID=UPI0030DC7AF3